jgi:16S rRNA (cytidine1402-2'-O)-methyltransferase
MSGCLYLVATPIGNREDITLRALRVLKSSSVIACEDTRHSKPLLVGYEVHAPLVSVHAHSGEGAIDRLLDRVEAGEEVSYVSDAGTPDLSDPGGLLVKAAVRRGLRVEPVPGPSALLAALSGAGLETGRFCFLGFLGRKASERRELLAPYAALPTALVLFEAPTRLGELLEDLRVVLGDRPACVARELTKRFETFERGSLSALKDRFSEPPKGEVVVVVGPPSLREGELRGQDVEIELRRLLEAGLGANEVAKVIAGAFGLAKKDAYQRVLASVRKSDAVRNPDEEEDG